MSKYRVSWQAVNEYSIVVEVESEADDLKKVKNGEFSIAEDMTLDSEAIGEKKHYEADLWD